MRSENMQPSELTYETIRIEEETPFCTDSGVDAFRVDRGNVRVSVACYAGEAAVGAMVTLCTMKPGDVFPGLFYRDMDYNRWVIRVDPEDKEAQISRMPGLITRILQARFCSRIGCENFASDGFESVLIDRYYSSKPQVVVTNAEPLFTDNVRDYYRVVRGKAMLSVVPTTAEKRKNSRRIGRVDPGLVFPGVCGRDSEGTVWQFMIRPVGGTVVLEVGAGMVTEPLREAFRHQLAPDNSEEKNLAKIIRDIYREQEQQDSRRIAQGAEYRSRVAESVVGLIWDAVSEKYVDPNTAAEPDQTLYKVLSYACRRSRIDLISWERVLECFNGPADVQDIARESNFICRRVVLDAEWYRSDCGVLMCTMDDAPVACVPSGSGGYVCFDGTKEVPVTGAMRERIEPEAYSIGRALPKTKLSFRQVRSFCMQSINKRELGRLLLLSLLGTLIGIWLPKLSQMVYDRYIPAGQMEMIAQLCLLMGTFMVSNLFFSLVKKMAEFRIGCHVEYDFQNAVYLRIFQLPESFFRGFDSADLADRLQSAGPSANTIVSGIIGSGFSFLFSMLYLYRMIEYSGTLTAFAALMLALFLGVQFLLDKLALKHQRVMVEQDSRANSRLYQFLSAVDKVRMAGAEERALYECMVPVAERQRSAIRENRLRGAASALKDISVYLFAIVFYYIAIRNRLGISLGGFAGFNAAFGSLSGAVAALMGTGLEIYRLKPVFERLKPVLATAPEDDGTREIVQDLEGAVSFEHVTFGYSEETGNVLTDVSFSIRPGEYVAIVGPSGCGKSTALKLLLGFETPRSGRVCYDERDLRSVDVHSLRRKLGVVLQNGKLISGSIFENITITAPHATPEDVDRILEAVGMKEDIDRMPMGVRTLISEDGATISGGQLQRILIARAIAGDPRILYFDEATSALDNRTQAKVVDNLNRMRMTRVVIAHRLSTIRTCDRILVFDKGEIREQGTYEQLMAKGPGHLFYDMAIRQIAEDRA